MSHLYRPESPKYPRPAVRRRIQTITSLRRTPPVSNLLWLYASNRSLSLIILIQLTGDRHKGLPETDGLSWNEKSRVYVLFGGERMMAWLSRLLLIDIAQFLPLAQKTRKWCWEWNSFHYRCSSCLKIILISQQETYPVIAISAFYCLDFSISEKTTTEVWWGGAGAAGGDNLELMSLSMITRRGKSPRHPRAGNNVVFISKATSDTPLPPPDTSCLLYCQDSG